ncbi:hypothetical protein LO80_08205 [Candidatus Francisella endociliophora]|uniref:Uncharacterized protein n=1 Tax=Candidatus Francisella endociliophora TaxID=653937 RepID=A0A097EQV7_9GAMM|nr:hypothetical protein [Francisella sp. FSC1006]AIT09950.1 hypothetical protein LO80_08205 [Francisella sp. FSC1006]
MKLFRVLIVFGFLIPCFLFAAIESSSELPKNPTSVQAQQYIDTSKDCMIVQNKKQVVLKCGNNMIFVTPEGVGIKTPSVSKFWS